MNRHDKDNAWQDTDALAAQLGRILDSEAFASTPLLSRFLKYIVEHRIHGDPGSLKEYTLGVDVFDRGEAFDPRTDTIVRVNARRLRARLADYYRTEGRHDPIRIDMPKGHYVAEVRAATALETSSSGDEIPSPQRRREDHTPSTAAPGRELPITLPAPRTALVGRERSLDDLCTRLRDPAIRLLTLSGAGGSGKTRLALAAAWQSGDTFPGGVVFVELATVADGDAFARTVAQALGVRRTKGKPLPEAITGYLRQRIASPMLLVLDNLEQIAGQLQLIGSLLDACASLTVLATSRVALHVYGEHEYPVDPLDLPSRDPLPSLAELECNAAVQLFLQRADAASPGYALTADHAPAIVELCCRLDGLPLAIELVAAHARKLAPEAMLERFAGYLDLPAHAAHDLPARQTTLRRTIDWSYALLGVEEQTLLRRLAVFAGGFTAEAAEAVADCAGDLGLGIDAGLASLVDKNLLYLDSIEPEPRYAKLVTIRAYALERLAASREETRIRRAHAAYMLVLAEEGNAELEVAEREVWLTRCDREQDNFRVALDGLLQRRDVAWALRLGQALFGYWERREHLSEGYQYLQAILDRSDVDTDPSVRAKVEAYTATLVAFQGDLEAAFARFQGLTGTYRSLGDHKGLASALNSLGVMAKHSGEYARARDYFEQALTACRALGDQREIAAALSNLAGALRSEGSLQRARVLLHEARALFVDIAQPVAATWCGNHLADVARDAGDYPLARQLYRQAEAEFGHLGDRWGTGRSLTDLGHLALIEGQLTEAGVLFTRALKIFRGLGHRRGVARLLDGCMQLALQRGDSVCALRLAGAASAIRSMLELAHRKDEQAQLDTVLAQVWRASDPETAQQAWDAGNRMAYPQAIEYALATLQASAPASG